MLYLEHTPAPPLNRFVQMLWYARVTQSDHTRERILPGGHTQVIVNLARGYLLDCPKGEPQLRSAPSAVVGARSIYEIVHTSDMADLIGVVFQPDALPLFVRHGHCGPCRAYHLNRKRPLPPRCERKPG